MKLSLLQAFCLFGTVFLCGAQGEGDTSTTTAPETSTMPETDATETSTVLPTVTTDTSNMTTVNASDITTITTTSDSTESSPTTEIVKEPDSGLSPGAIAGITIGSIAGVAAVGGGIFGILKYTGKI